MHIYSHIKDVDQATQKKISYPHLSLDHHVDNFQISDPTFRREWARSERHWARYNGYVARNPSCELLDNNVADDSSILFDVRKGVCSSN